MPVEADQVQEKRRGRRRKVLTAVLLGVGIASFTAIDVAYTPIVFESAVVTAERDTWSFKGGSRCVTSLRTALGDASDSERGSCSDRAWHVGERLEVRVRIGRISRRIYVYKLATALPRPAEPNAN